MLKYIVIGLASIYLIDRAKNFYRDKKASKIDGNPYLKSIGVWSVMAWIALLGQLISLLFYIENSRNLEVFFSSNLAVVQLLLLVAAALHVYVSSAVKSNFDLIEQQLNELKNPKSKNNPQEDDEGNDGSN